MGKVKLRKMDNDGKPMQIDGKDVIAEYPSESADKMAKSKYWEVVEDSRESKGSPKPSRKEKKEEAKSEKQSEEPSVEEDADAKQE